MPQYNPSDYDPSKDGSNFTPPPAGDYPFTVINAEEKISKAGNDMIGLTLECDIGREDPLKVFDNLVFVPKAIWKVAQFCKATGYDFDSGELSATDAIGLTGKAHLALGETNASGKRYMEVGYYLTAAGFSESPQGPSTPPPAKPAAASAPKPAQHVPPDPEEEQPPLDDSPPF